MASRETQRALLRVLPEILRRDSAANGRPFHCAKDDMDYLPPVVVEHVLPSDFDAGWIVSRLYFRREKESFGLDFDSRRGALIGARYGDTAHIATGAAHDSRWTLKLTVPF